MEAKPYILGIGGTMRAGSSSEKALLVSLRAAEAAGARIELVSGAALDVPMFSPHSEERTEQARKLVEMFRRCDGVIVSSPSYHGSISGLLKNALDYTEDLSRDQRVYLDGCPVGLIACGAGWQGASQLLAALRAIAHALRAWPTPLGAMLNTAGKLFDENGACLDSAAKFQLETVGKQVVEFARMKRAASLLSECALAH